MYRREAGGTAIFPNDFLRRALIVCLKLKFGDIVFLKAQKNLKITTTDQYWSLKMYRHEAGGTPIFPKHFLRQALIVPLKLKFRDNVFLKAQKKLKIMDFVSKLELEKVPP